MASFDPQDEGVEIEVTRIPIKIRPPWRVRLKVWWHRKTTPANVLAIEDRISARMEEAFLFGDKPTFPEEREDDHVGVPPDEEIYAVGGHERFETPVTIATIDERAVFVTREMIQDMHSFVAIDILRRNCGDFGVRISPIERQPWPTPEERLSWYSTTVDDE